jgi:peroxiredoxin
MKSFLDAAAEKFNDDWDGWSEKIEKDAETFSQATLSLIDLFGEDKVAVLALNFRESGRTARRFLSSSGIQVPVALDPSGDIAKAWGVRAFPTTVLIDRSGQARQVVQGEVDWLSAPALAWVERLLGQR